MYTSSCVTPVCAENVPIHLSDSSDGDGDGDGDGLARHLHPTIGATASHRLRAWLASLRLIECGAK